MKPLQPATIPEDQLTRAIADTMLLYDQNPAPILQAIGMLGDPLDRDEVERRVSKLVHESKVDCAMWKNDVYTVAVYKDPPPYDRWPEIIHLSIKRNDREPVRDWRDVQEMKNQLTSPEHEGVELYPAQSRLVDAANQYHLWIPNDPEFRFPFGFTSRLVVDHMEGTASKQRKL